MNIRERNINIQGRGCDHSKLEYCIFKKGTELGLNASICYIFICAKLIP